MAALTLALAAADAAAQVEVTAAWARATVTGQTGSGAFMTLTAKEHMRIVGAASTVARVTEIHEMAMDGNVMRMRAVPVLELPAGRPIELKPGGYHLMLLDLKRALKPGEKIAVDLRLETKDGKPLTQPIEIDVRAATAASSGAHKH